MLHRVSGLDGFFGTNYATENGHEIWNLDVRSLHRSGSLKTLATELAKYKEDSVGFFYIKDWHQWLRGYSC
jgi:hypothetical protein